MTDTANNNPITATTSSPLAGFSSYDISTEQWRRYHYANGDTYTISNPKTLLTKPVIGFVDSHRVIDGSNITHCPTKGWINISWFAPTEPVSF